MLQSFSIPSGIATKRLKIKNTGDKAKIAISSNLLRLFNFEHRDRVIEMSLGKGKGILIKRVSSADLFSGLGRTKQVYQRQYRHRRNNPLETLLEVSSQKLIDEAIPTGCTHVHVTMRQNEVTIKPIVTHKAKAILNATPGSRYEMFAACSSGVDLTECCEPMGWRCHSLIEYRPVEQRDLKRKSDLTETGAISALMNLKNGIRNLFCEDITTIDVGMLAEAVSESPATVFLASPQCDDYSPLKSNSLKASSMEDLSSTMDMMYDIVRVTEAIAPPVVVLENVRGFFTSDVYKMAALRLRKLGYGENLLIADARDHGGLTSRVRGYAVFSCLDAPFDFEPASPRRDIPIWPICEKHLPDCRDVTHSKAIQDGFSCKRLRVISKESTCSPTIVKSLSRGAKDSVVLRDGDRFLFPSEGLLKELMGIKDYDLSAVSKDIGGEIIGQSIDVPAFTSIMRSVSRHLDAYFGSLAPVSL